MAQLGYYRHPTIHDDTIAFVAEDDLWAVSTSGGTAARITANPGRQSHPRLSPDGSRIAYVSLDEGRSEVHVVGVDGGSGRRLTHLGASVIAVVGWDPDGSSVLFASDHAQAFPGWVHLYRVGLDGSAPQPLKVGPAWSIDHGPSGGTVLARHGFDPARWKRYRGGRAGRLWIDREGTGFETFGDLDGNLASPMWVGRRIYFLSDHEGVGNIYSLTVGGRSLRRHTDHAGFYARFAASDGRRIVYHAGADLWLLDPGNDEHHRVDVRLRTAIPQRNRKFVTAAHRFDTVRLHPEGHSLAMTVRGAAFAAPLWEGAPSRFGGSSAVRRRLATWLPDGERIVSVTDETGEERLVVERVDRAAEPVLIDRPIGRVRSLDPAPAGGTRVAITNHRHEVVLVDVPRKSARIIHRSPYSWIGGVAWSPDGRWLAFGASTSRTTMNIHLYDTTDRRLHVLGEREFVDSGPTFDPSGRYLGFLSSRVLEPVADTAFHDYGFPRTTVPIIVSLRSGTPAPTSVAQRLPHAPGQPRPAGDDDKAVVVDFEGIEGRMAPLPVPVGRYSSFRLLGDRALLVSWPVRAAGQSIRRGESVTGTLQSWDFGSDKLETVVDGASAYTVSADGKTMAIRLKKKLRVVPTSWKDDKNSRDAAVRETGWIDLDRFRVEVLPVAEWRQMFDEAWRLQRDHFWSEDMTGVDWLEIHDRYAALVDRLGSRSEFGDLVWEMQGELGTSHAYEMGGDYRPAPTWTLGRLGADVTWRRGAWRIDKLLQGDAWDPEATSPLAAAGVEVRPGDRILAVDGTALDEHTTPESLLVHRAGRPVTLDVATGRRRPRTVIVTPLSSETKLRYRDWVISNRRIVTERSDGRLGYIHIPDMGPSGFAEFHRSFRAEVDHAGLVVDVRFNRGGNVSQLLLEKLIRARVGYRVMRWRDPVAMPTDAPAGPMVCLTNEMAGSDGDIFSHVFKLRRLGPLIGTRTWGGVVGIWPQHALVDGTVTTQPEFSTWFFDVGYGIENSGTVPDVELENTPSDHAAGHDAQLERAIEEAVRLVEAADAGLPDFTDRPSLAPPTLGPRP